MPAFSRRRFIAASLGAAGSRLLPGAPTATPKFDFHVHLGHDSADMRQVTREKLPDFVKYLTGEMDRHHVQKAMIVAVEPAFPTELYLEAAKLAPERLMVACSVLPRPLTQAIDRLKSYQERGARALKLQPAQYDPQDPAVERLVYEAVKLHMPVLFHHMDTPKTFPAMLDHFANTFGDGKFVVIHFGGVYGFQEMLPFTRLPNVWLETSVAFPRIVNGSLRGALQFLAAENRLDRLIFGSELPREYDTVCGAIDELLGPNAAPALVKSVYRGNADRLLRISRTARLRDEEEERERRWKAGDVISAVGAREGARIAEVGPGPGFWVMRLAPKVGASGKIFASDISKTAVDDLRRRAEEDEIANIEVIHGEDADPKLPKGELDGILIVNSYHEFKAPDAMLDHLAEALKPGGRLVVLDGVAKDHRTYSRQQFVEWHEFTPDLLEEEVRKHGFEVAERRDPVAIEGGREIWMVIARRK